MKQKRIMRFIWNNIILGIFINFFIAPFAYWFRNWAQERKNFLWTFLSDDNMYGDTDWKTGLKNKFWKAYFWMLRNPRQNWYWKDFVEGVESEFKGTGRIKFNKDIIAFRTVLCSDTGDWHGKIIDFEASPFGVQDIIFLRKDIKGNIQNCYRKSRCVPYRIGPWIVLNKWRRGHENGLMQYSIAKPLFSYKKNKEGWELWKKEEWKTIKI